MKVTILCSDPTHPVNRWLGLWMEDNRENHEIALLRKASEIVGGDILFLVSCSEIILATHREQYKKTLVLHASDLPLGRGWSPHIWQLLDGQTEFTLTMLEAEDSVDSGNIVKKEKFHIGETALWNEISDIIGSRQMALIDYAVNNFDNLPSIEQNKDVKPTYYGRRTPKDSEIDPDKTIAEQFDLIRVCDPDRYPAHFQMRGQKYKLILEKIDG
ncbi:UDP-glucuronic acid dehydrogenase [Rhizobium sp. 16-449-1b]|uniref:formyltransferase family protein n=1 Tax=Rhizobium sp. 16-449-1b TaxID=2819989 RepID=UPI001ADA930A|nr:formyltransferase family protein [Rhizobium sp. 16-449-1b]MBO9194829.1 UDP-glucuronic acid dehydrogenase [Rhizobium sp. 16-449-1b]